MALPPGLLVETEGMRPGLLGGAEAVASKRPGSQHRPRVSPTHLHMNPRTRRDGGGWPGSPLQPQMLKHVPASRWHAREAAPRLERALLSSWALGKEGGQPSGRRMGRGAEPGRKGDIAPPAAAPGPCRLVQSTLLSSWTTEATSLFLGTALGVYWCEQAAEVSPLGVGASMAGVLKQRRAVLTFITCFS